MSLESLLTTSKAWIRYGELSVFHFSKVRLFFLTLQCYKNFVELMDKTPSKVVVCDWDNFGAPSDIAAHINAVKTDSVGSWFKDVNGLRSL